MGGARIEGEWESARLAFTSAVYRYAPEIASPQPDGHPFRGAGDAVSGLDASGAWGGARVALDAALSSGGGRRGTAVAGTLTQEEKRMKTWATVFAYGGGYFARHAKGPAFDVQDQPSSLPVNQRGLTLGARGEGEGGYAEGEAAWALFPGPIGDGKNEDPVFASQARRWRLEVGRTFSPTWSGSLRLQERTRDRSLTPPGGAAPVQGSETVRKLRGETVWRPEDALRLRLRYDVRWERTGFAGLRAEGRSVMAEAAWRPGGGWSAAGRVFAFQSPEAFLTSGVEEVWDGVLSPSAAAGLGNLRGAPGERYVLSVRRRWDEGLSAWAGFAENPRRSAGASRRSWRVQTDLSW
jgi:hypothetical protein